MPATASNGRGLEAELRRRGIAANFRLPGFIPDVENAMDGFDIGVSTALWEGLPQSLVQLRLKKKAVRGQRYPRQPRSDPRRARTASCCRSPTTNALPPPSCDWPPMPELRRRLGNFAAEDFSEWSADVMVARQEELYQRLLLDSWTGS